MASRTGDGPSRVISTRHSRVDGKLTDGDGYECRVAIRRDGKIVAVGTVLARYNLDGSPDTTFGGGTGKVAAEGDSLAIQPDGKIVIVCGSCNTA